MAAVTGQQSLCAQPSLPPGPPSLAGLPQANPWFQATSWPCVSPSAASTWDPVLRPVGPPGGTSTASTLVVPPALHLSSISGPWAFIYLVLDSDTPLLWFPWGVGTSAHILLITGPHVHVGRPPGAFHTRQKCPYVAP